MPSGICYDAKAPLKQIQFLLPVSNDEQKFGGKAVRIVLKLVRPSVSGTNVPWWWT